METKSSWQPAPELEACCIDHLVLSLVWLESIERTGDLTALHRWRCVSIHDISLNECFFLRTESARTPSFSLRMLQRREEAVRVFS